LSFVLFCRFITYNMCCSVHLLLYTFFQVFLIFLSDSGNTVTDKNTVVMMVFILIRLGRFCASFYITKARERFLTKVISLSPRFRLKRCVCQL